MSQFTTSVITRPLGLRRTSRTDVKSTFIIIGVIISQIRTAIGTLIWLPAPNSTRRKASTAAGSSLPITTPATMQAATQTLSYRSKRFSLLGLTGTAICIIVQASRPSAPGTGAGLPPSRWPSTSPGWTPGRC